MDLYNQLFDKLYSEYINDTNLIVIALDIIKELNINYINLEDIKYFIILFKQYYPQYMDNIEKSLLTFIQNNSHLLAHCPNDKYIVGSEDNINYLKQINDIEDIYNHYDVSDVVKQYRLYLHH